MELTVLKKKKASYFRQILKELKKVSWTAKDKLISSTKVVILSTFICAFGIYIADIIIRFFLSITGNFFRWLDICINGM